GVGTQAVEVVVVVAAAGQRQEDGGAAATSGEQGLTILAKFRAAPNVLAARAMCVAAASRLAHHAAVTSPSPRRWAVAALAGLLGACEPRAPTNTMSTGETGETGEAGDGDAPGVCLRYVACLTEIDAAAGAEAELSHGASGTCWTEG